MAEPALTREQALALAWTYCAPNRVPSDFPRGFWPDVARVAMEMFTQQTATPELSFRPTMCSRGDAPEVIRVKRKGSLGINLDKLEISL